MYQYTDAELTNKIHAFLGRKMKKFPELNSYAPKPARKVVIKDYRESSLFTVLENLNSLWAQRIHS